MSVSSDAWQLLPRVLRILVMVMTVMTILQGLCGKPLNILCTLHTTLPHLLSPPASSHHVGLRWGALWAAGLPILGGGLSTLKAVQTLGLKQGTHFHPRCLCQLSPLSH